MPDKSFEITIPFVETEDGWFPLIEVVFLRPDNRQLTLPLLFDTGAENICLHPYWEWAFPDLKPQRIHGVGKDGWIYGKSTQGRVKLLGSETDCEILFAPMLEKTWRAGLLGRDCFKSFGFGFWESARELYVTLKP